MGRSSNYDTSKNVFRHHLIPERDEGLDVGLVDQRFNVIRAREIQADVATFGTQVFALDDTGVTFSAAGLLTVDATNFTWNDSTNTLTVANLALTNDLPVAQGGTAASTAAGARTNLGAAPLDAQFVTLATNSEVTNERVLTGTANQIVITDNGAGSTVVLSLPQNVHTAATPTFGGITLSGTATINGANLVMGTGNPTIVPAAVSGTPAQHGLYRENVAKAWVTIDGDAAPAVALDSFNLTSITDNGTGDYTITWDRDFANADYCPVVSIEDIDTGFAANKGKFALIENAGKAVGTTRVKVNHDTNSANAAVDVTAIHVAIFGDQ